MKRGAAMLNAVIVDDEIPAVNLLKLVLEKTGQVNVLKTFTDSSDALENISKIKPDVAFLDIEMPEMRGLELASRFMEQDDTLMVVFVTGYNQYALEAFQVNALDYILKPVHSNAIDKCISRLIRLKGLKTGERCRESQKGICCLGNFEVFGSNGAVKFATRKVEEMLAYFMIYRNTNVDGWELGEILWPEEDPEKVKSNLHTTLFRLRKTIREEGLPINIMSEKGGNGVYRCIFGELSCDLYEFESLIKRNSTVNKDSINEYERVCGLYRDDLFCKKSYEWCESIREWLQRYYIDMLNNMAFYYISEKSYQKAINKLLTAAGKAPYDEEIHRNLLKVYGEQKNKALLAKCHDEFKQRLKKELGVKPQAETEQLFVKLLSE